MKKIITSILIISIFLLCFGKYSYATGQLQAVIEITPNSTEVNAGDTVIFTFVTKNIENAEYEKIYAIEGVIEYDENFFQLEDGGMEVGDTGRFISMTPVREGETNGTIILKVKDNATGSGVVKFTELFSGDGRAEDATSTSGIASTEDYEFTINVESKITKENNNNAISEIYKILIVIMVITVIILIVKSKNKKKT